MFVFTLDAMRILSVMKISFGIYCDSHQLNLSWLNSFKGGVDYECLLDFGG